MGGKRKAVIDLTQDSEEDEPLQTSGRGKRQAGGGPGGGRQTVAAAAPAPAKWKGKKKDAEKRQDAAGQTVRWAPKPSQQIKERMDRALAVGAGAAHRLYLLERREVAPVGSEHGAAEDFTVQGATGNVYTVSICRQPCCTCPDFLKRHNLCKHILFVMLRVLGLGRDDPLVWQRAFLTAELDEVLGGARRVRAEPAPLATAAVREQYRRLSGGGGGDAGCTQQRPVEGDCPICFDEMTVGGEAVEYCRACLNNFHAACLKMHKDHRHATGVAATCPLCRAPLEEDGSGGAVGTYIRVGSGAAPSLNELYGDRSIWIHAHQGAMSMGEAAALWNAMR